MNTLSIKSAALLVFGIFFAALLPNVVFAQSHLCYAQDRYTSTRYPLPIVYTSAPSSGVVINPNVGINMAAGQVNITFSSSVDALIDCGIDTNTYTFNSTSISSGIDTGYGSSGVTYKTNIAGLGYVITSISSSTGGGPPVGQSLPSSFTGAGQVPTLFTITMQILFVKYANFSVTNGATLINPGVLFYNLVSNPANSNTRVRNWVLSGPITAAPAPTPTCSLSTSSATFNMGTLAASTFTGGAGHTYNWVADQSLISGGCNASTVSMTFAGTAASAPYSSAFKNAGTAKGVALQLWQASGSQAIPNGAAIHFAPQGTGGRYTFSARYIQTAPAVTTGSVSATVTVTVNYQ